MSGLFNLRRYGASIARHHLLACGGSTSRRPLPHAFGRALHTTAALDRVVSFHLSDIGEGIREVTVKEWYVKVGDVVEQFDNLCEVQSDKASVTITSRYDGKIVKLHHDVDGVALVGKPLLDFDVVDEEGDDSGSSSSSDSSSSDEEDTKAAAQQAGLVAAAAASGKVLATPAVRRIAMENKVDLSKVPATGRNGRVLKGDVLEFLEVIPKGTVKPHPSLVAKEQRKAETTAPLDLKQAETVVPLKGVDVTRLVAVRAELKEEAAARGVKLTYMPFFLKAASNALLQHPILNSSFDEPSESVIYKRYHNISVAMQTPQGLVVPNVKSVEQKSILQIAQDLNALQERGAKGALTPNDFANGTFALSNIGIIGGTYTHPVVMTPQVAIGGLGQTRVLPRFDADGRVVPAHIMVVSWTADHRIIDGVTMASFSNLWKQYLENPNLLMLGAK
uniref:Dihydrolipoamide acetyltransferase component of pyruvate dehydrogenase complex n=1 Tax=Anopheles quadriannulatus TaxID=34691 RepID=A0A182XLS8_ANOQN